MEDRESMMGPRDVAEAILLCATLPQRTVIEQIVMTPSHIRDQSHDVRRAGARGRHRSHLVLGLLWAARLSPPPSQMRFRALDP